MKIQITKQCNCLFLSLILSILFLIYPFEGQAAGDFEVTINPSRTEGVAPLSVFFDATQTPQLADGSYVDATFAWHFDMDNTDPGAKYVEASGFVAAHVFENPGAYRVRVNIYDTLGRHAYEDVTITVLPFTGQTYYVAVGENASDQNSGLTMDDPIETVNHALLEMAQPNTRILFRNGDTFNTRFVNASGQPGPVIIANYNDPNQPSEQPPIIYNTGVDNDWATIYLGNDWRIMDLRVRSGGSSAGEAGPRYPGGVGFGNESNNSLIYRLEQDNLASQWMDPYGQYNTVAECNIHHVSGTGYCSGGDGGALIGNWVHDKGPEDPEHIFRLQGGTRYFIAFNNFEANVVNYDSLTIRGNSDKVVIYKNQLDRLTSIWPQNRNSAEEYQHHCIIDSNLFIGRDNPPGYITTTPIRQVAIGLHSKDIVVRNNIIYNYEFGISIGDDTVVGPSQRIKVYNNTAVNMTPDSSFYFINADPACFDLEVNNNLILDDAGSSLAHSRIIRDRSETNTFNGRSNNNMFFGSSWNEEMILFNAHSLSQWQTATGNDTASRFQNPELAGLDMESANFMRPSEGSQLINAGQMTGAALDYYGNVRDLSRDIGAVESISGVVDTESPVAPADLVASSLSSSEIDLSWSPSSDNIEVVGYRIYRDGELIATTAQTNFDDTGCEPGTSYAYTVRAYDAAGNVSLPSSAASVTTAGQSADNSIDGGGGSGGGCFMSVAASDV